MLKKVKKILVDIVMWPFIILTMPYGLHSISKKMKKDFGYRLWSYQGMMTLAYLDSFKHWFIEAYMQAYYPNFRLEKEEP